MKILYIPVLYYPAYLAWNIAYGKGKTDMQLSCDGVGVGIVVNDLTDEQINDAWMFFTGHVIRDREISIWGNGDKTYNQLGNYDGHRRFLSKWVENSSSRLRNSKDIFPTLTSQEADKRNRAVP